MKLQVSIRRFKFEDIVLKVSWINNPENNQFLHYDLPLEYEKTCAWYEKNKDRTDRYDAVIEVNGMPVGLIGLLSIDRKNQKAEYYVSMGEISFKGQGVALKASELLLDYAFQELELNRCYLFTEIENIPAQRLFEKIGFIKEGCIREDVVSHESYVDRLVYGLLKKDWKKLRGEV